MPPRPTREQLLATPRSGARAGATRGGIGARHGEHAGGELAADGGGTPADTTRPLPRASSASSTTSSTPSSTPSKGRARGGSGGGLEGRWARRQAAGGSRSLTSTVSLEGGGLVVAAFAWPLAVNLLKGGPSRMWGWVKAKFINQPYTGTPDTSGVGTPPGKIPGAYHGHAPSLGRKK